MELPQNVIEEMKYVVNLQDNFKDLDEYNYNEALKNILESPFFAENDFILKVSRYHQFWENVHVCLRERPKSFFMYVRIIVDIFHTLEKQELINPFETNTQTEVDYKKYDYITSQTIVLSKQIQFECQSISIKSDGDLFSHIFLEITKNRCEEFYVQSEEPQLLMFCYHLFKNGIFNKEKLYYFLNQIKDDSSVIYPSVYSFFQIFAPEVEEKEKENPVFFDHFTDNFGLALRYMETRDFQNNFNEYKANNYEKLKLFRNQLDFGNIILEALLNDDVELFKKYISSHPNFKPDMRLDLPLFAPFDYLHQNPPIIGAAAFLGSVNLFKYLLMLGASLQLIDSFGHTVIQFAAAGGSIEIIRLIEQEQQNIRTNPNAYPLVHHEPISFDGALQVSSGFSRYEIFEWILETQKYSISSIDDSRGNVAGHASLENNPHLFQRCVEENADLNCLDTKGRFPIMKAITYRGYDVFRIMMLLPQIDISIRYNSYSLVTIAVEKNEDWMAKMLLEDKRTIINEKDQSDIVREMVKNHSMRCFRNVLCTHQKINFLVGLNYSVIAMKNHFLFHLKSKEFFNYFYNLDPSFFSQNFTYYEIVASKNLVLLERMISHKVGDINLDNGKALFAQILLNNEKGLSLLFQSDLIDLNVKYKELYPYQFAKKVRKPEMYSLVIKEMKKRNLIRQEEEETFEIPIEEEEEDEEEEEEEEMIENRENESA